MKILEKIVKVEDKETQAGKKFVRVELSSGKWVSAFDSGVIKEAKRAVGEAFPISMNVVTNEKGFTTLKGIGEVGSFKEEKDAPISQKNSFERDKSTSVYTSYAKDIFIESMRYEASKLIDSESKTYTPEELMKAAINLVKQAKKAFEEQEE